MKLAFIFIIGIILFVYAIIALSGCASRTGDRLYATPFTQAKWSDGTEIDTKLFPSELVIK